MSSKSGIVRKTNFLHRPVFWEKVSRLLTTFFVRTSFIKFIPAVNGLVFNGRSTIKGIRNNRLTGNYLVSIIASAVICADSAAKAADVRLIEIRLGRGLGGKAFFTMNGDVAAVKAAVDAALEEGQEHGMIVNSVVIPAPHEDIYKAIY